MSNRIATVKAHADTLGLGDKLTVTLDDRDALAKSLSDAGEAFLALDIGAIPTAEDFENMLANTIYN